MIKISVRITCTKERGSNKKPIKLRDKEFNFIIFYSSQNIIRVIKSIRAE
jgi:hypothetical protein